MIYCTKWSLCADVPVNPHSFPTQIPNLTEEESSELPETGQETIARHLPIELPQEHTDN